MANRLLDRQVELLEYLTSGAAIFGDGGDAAHEAAWHGIDRSSLRLEARFSHEKRMEKIAVVFRRTLKILGDDASAVVRAFAAACPPVDISRIENERQFHDFLCDRLRCERLDLPFVRDVAACELAFAKARVGVEEGEPQARSDEDRDGIRRRRGLVLLRCVYDIRPIFEGGSGEAAPIKRDTPLAIGIPPGADEPRVLELLPAVFDLVAALDDWTDPAALGATPELQALIRDLAQHGVLEVRG